MRSDGQVTNRFFCKTLPVVVVLPALALTALACGDVASPVFDPTSVDLEFTYQLVHFSDPSGTAVDGGNGSLVVRGSFVTGSAGFELRAEFLGRDKGYELSIIADRVSGGLDVPVHYRHETILRDLPPGRYALLVAYRNPDEGTQVTAFDGHVEVK